MRIEVKRRFHFIAFLLIAYAVGSILFGFVVGDFWGSLFSILFTPFNFTTGLELFVRHSTNLSYLMVIIPLFLIVVSFAVLHRTKATAYIVGIGSSVVLGALSSFLFFAMILVGIYSDFTGRHFR